MQLKAGDKLVLPSPNGATISFALQDQTDLAGCLRNCGAVAEAAMQLGKRILVIAAGEKWDDDSIRPGIEDLIGAGAIISELKGSKSPEAKVAQYAFNQFQDVLALVFNYTNTYEYDNNQPY